MITDFTWCSLNSLKVIAFVWKCTTHSFFPFFPFSPCFLFSLFFFNWNHKGTSCALLNFHGASRETREELNTFFAPEFVPKHKNSHLQGRQLQEVLPAGWASFANINMRLLARVDLRRFRGADFRESALADGTKMSSARYVLCNSDEFTVEISQSWL